MDDQIQFGFITDLNVVDIVGYPTMRQYMVYIENLIKL